jgi:hypothetical protein
MLQAVKRLKSITVPTLSFKNRDLLYIRCIGELFKGKDLSGAGEGPTRKPADLMRVINLEDGVEYELVCPTLLVSTLKEKVIDYVGKCFEVHATADKIAGKNYKGITVHEIEDPEGGLIR